MYEPTIILLLCYWLRYNIQSSLAIGLQYVHVWLKEIKSLDGTAGMNPGHYRLAILNLWKVHSKALSYRAYIYMATPHITISKRMPIIQT